MKETRADCFSLPGPERRLEQGPDVHCWREGGSRLRLPEERDGRSLQTPRDHVLLPLDARSVRSRTGPFGAPSERRARSDWISSYIFAAPLVLRALTRPLPGCLPDPSVFREDALGSTECAVGGLSWVGIAPSCRLLASFSDHIYRSSHGVKVAAFSRLSTLFGLRFQVLHEPCLLSDRRRPFKNTRNVLALIPSAVGVSGYVPLETRQQEILKFGSR